MQEIHQRRFFIFSIFLPIFLFFLCSGCAYMKTQKNKDAKVPTSSKQVKHGPAPFYYDFGDVLIPGELKVDKAESFIYKSSNYSAGVLVLNGRVNTVSLINFFENNMAKDNWETICSFKAEQTLLLFRKENRWCIISVCTAQFSTQAKIWVAPTGERVESGLLKEEAL